MALVWWAFPHCTASWAMSQLLITREPHLLLVKEGHWRFRRTDARLTTKWVVLSLQCFQFGDVWYWGPNQSWYTTVSSEFVLCTPLVSVIAISSSVGGKPMGLLFILFITLMMSGPHFTLPLRLTVRYLNLSALCYIPFLSILIFLSFATMGIFYIII